MLVRCPHCADPVEAGENVTLHEVECPRCGSSFSVVCDVETTNWEARRVGHFSLLEPLGSGAFGMVWKARDEQLDRWVAVKLPLKDQLNEKEQQQFLREARAAAQLRHPSIVSVHEVGIDNGQLYIVSELIEGATLSEWLTGKTLTTVEAVRLVLQLAEALQHAHQHGVIHRDLKPQNVLLDSAGMAYVTDFGLARREAGEITVTLEGQVLGTPAYMSPEQARGASHRADARSDLYSLGVILYQLLTGELPFRGTPRMLLLQVLNDDPPSPRKMDSRLSRDLETITLKCLEKDRERRYASAQALADDLRRYLEGIPILARPISRPERVWRWCNRRPAVTALSLTLAAAAIVGGVILAAGISAIRQSNRNLVQDNAVLKDAMRQLEAVGDELKSAQAMERRNADEALEALEDSKKTLAQIQYGHQLLTGLLSNLDEIPATSDGQLRNELGRRLIEMARKMVNTSLGDAYITSSMLNLLVGQLNNYSVSDEEVSELVHHALRSLKSSSPKDGAMYELKLQLAGHLVTVDAKKAYDALIDLLKETEDFGDHHPIQLHARFELARLQQAARNFDSAVHEMAQLQDQIDLVFGKGSDLSLDLMHYRGVCRSAMGDYKAAIRLLQSVVQATEERQGTHDLDTLVSMRALGEEYARAEDLDQAINTLNDALRRAEERYGRDAEITWTVKEALATVQLSTEHVDRALATLQNLHQAQWDRMTWEHPKTVRLALQLGRGYLDTGSPEEVLQLYEPLTTGRKLVSDQTQLARIYGQLGYAHGEMKEYKSAVSSYDQAARLRFEYAGKDDAQGLSYVISSAAHRVQMRQFDQALSRLNATRSQWGQLKLASQWRARTTLGSALRGAGHKKDAEDVLTKLLPELRAKGAEAELQDVLRQLGLLYTREQPVKSIQYLKEELSLFEKQQPSETRDDGIATARLFIGLNYISLGQGKLGRDNLSFVAKYYRVRCGSTSRELLQVLNRIAMSYAKDRIHSDQMIAVNQEILSIHRANGKRDVDTMRIMQNLAVGYWQRKEYRKAIPIFEECVAFLTAAAGPNHSLTLVTQANLAVNYLDSKGEAMKGLSLLDSTWKKTRARNPRVPELDFIPSRLAEAFIDNGEIDKALGVLMWEIDRSRAEHGPDAQKTLSSMRVYGTFLNRLKRGKASVDWHTELVARCQRVLGENHERTLSATNNLALGYEYSGDLEKSTDLFLATLIRMRQNLGWPHKETLNTLWNLLRVLSAQDEFGKIESICQEQLDQANDVSRITRSTLLHYLALAKLELQQASDGEKLLRQALEIRKQELPNNWRMFNTMSLLGEAISLQKRFAEAEPLLLKGYQGLNARRQQLPLSAHSLVNEAIERLVALYTRWQKPAEAEQWRSELPTKESKAQSN